MTVNWSSSTASVNARSLFLPYALALITAMVAIQLVIALSGDQVKVLAEGLTAAVALAIVVWLWRNHRHINHVRFGWTIAHAIAFATVTTSYNLHLFIHLLGVASGTNGFHAAAHDVLATPWFGATLAMSALWGIGFVIHLVGSVLGRGWDN